MSENRPGIASRLASQSGLVMLGNLFTLGVGFPFQIYLARKLGAEQLGAFGLLEVVAQTAAALLEFGLGLTLVRFIPQLLGLGQNRHARKLLATAYSVILLAGLCVAALLMVGAPYLTAWMPELQPYAHLFPFVGAMALLGMLTGLSQQALRAFLDIRYLVLMSSFLQLVLKVVIAVALIWLGWALMGYLVAVVVSSALAVAGLVWGLRGHVRRLDQTNEEISPEARKTWWAFSRTMYANSLLGIVAAPIERFMLAGMINLASVGILMAIRQLQSFPQVLLQVIIMVIAPMFVNARTKDDMEEVKHLYHIATNWVCRLGFPLLVFLFVFGNELLGLYGGEFSEKGYLPLLVLVVGQFVNLSMGPVGTMLNMVGYEKKLFQLNMVSSMMGYLLLLLLVPGLGLLGAAFASMLSMLFLNIAAWRIMQGKLGISWWSVRHKRLVAPLVATLVLALLADTLNLVQGAWTLAIGLAGAYVTFFLVYLTGGLSQEDKEVYYMLRGRLGLEKQLCLTDSHEK